MTDVLVASGAKIAVVVTDVLPFAVFVRAGDVPGMVRTAVAGIEVGDTIVVRVVDSDIIGNRFAAELA